MLATILPILVAEESKTNGLLSIKESSGRTGLAVKQVHACEDLTPSLSSG